MSGEYDTEPVRGLPARLPPGEHLLWQGSPRWQGVARRALHVRKLAVYFGALVAWRVIAAIDGGENLLSALLGCIWIVALALAAIGLLALLAWLTARTTVYTITNRRVVLRFGVALPMAINLPFKSIGSAALRHYTDGTGDIPLALTGDVHIAYLQLWPHARPWHVKHPEPMLRSVPDAAHVSEILAQAMTASLAATSSEPAERAARPPASARPLASAAA